MTDFENDVISKLTRLEASMETIREALTRDYRVLHGNGQPGLVHRVSALELNWRWVKYLAGVVGAGIGFCVSLFTKN